MIASKNRGYQFNGASSLFSGAGFMPPEAVQVSGDPSISPAKNRGAQGSLPLTVKQIAQGYLSGDDKSNLLVDGVDVVNVRLLGMVMNKAERVTDVSFTLDDGTGRIDINRWVNEVSDAQEMAAIQNGMYVKVNGHMKGFQGKRHVVGFSVQPVIDLNSMVLHFIECIYVHLVNKRQKRGAFAHMQTMGMQFAYGQKGYQAPLTNQYVAYTGMKGPANHICNSVLQILQEPAVLAHDYGLHVDEVVRRLRLPKNIIMDAITYHVNMGHIYSTVDEHHFKSACNL